MQRPRFLPGNFVLALIGAIVLASLLPVHGRAATAFDYLTTAAIALLFFLNGAKFSRGAIYAGATHWRLHLSVLIVTFLLFPVIGLVARPFLAQALTPGLYAGLLFLCVLPSTVQSSIAFTSIARGNVPAAVCSASLSNLLGVFATPLLAGVLISVHGEGGVSFAAIGRVILQILVPFVFGQLARRWLSAWVAAHPKVVKFVEHSSIVLVVYAAFSASVAEGLWHETPLSALALLFVIDAALLALVLGATFAVGRWFFARGDEIVLFFCGSQKSLATGIPIAKVLFASAALGGVVLPLVIFQQLQLMVCALLAQRYGRAASAREAVEGAGS